MKTVSVVIPVYNESAGIRKFHEKVLTPAIDNIKDVAFILYYVNDGSTDNSLEVLAGIAKNDSRTRIVCLSKNFGKEIALTAGLQTAKGDAVIVMDSDGQHPPKMINEFLSAWKNGSKVVIGVRTKNQNEGFVKRFGSLVFYRLFNTISTVKLVPQSTDFRLIDRVVCDEFNKLTEHNRISRALIDWLGFEKHYIKFQSPSRLAGEASYKVPQLVSLALNSFISLSLRPLFFFGWVGLIIMALSLILGIFICIEQLILRDPLSLQFTGTAMLGVFISFLVSLVLVSQSMIAIYMSHIYDETRNRPLFIVDKTKSINL